jgi:hypothetical protein
MAQNGATQNHLSGTQPTGEAPSGRSYRRDTKIEDYDYKKGDKD